MADIIFECNVCAKRVAVAQALGGKSIKCPDCNATLTVPFAETLFECPSCSNRFCAPSKMVGQSCICPDCSKEFIVPANIPSGILGGKSGVVDEPVENTSTTRNAEDKDTILLSELCNNTETELNNTPEVLTLKTASVPDRDANIRAARIISLIKALICIAITAFFFLLMYVPISESYRLHFDGKQAIGTVTNYKYEKRRTRKYISTYHYHTITYEKYRKQFDLHKQYPLGSQFYVLYLPYDPEIATIAKKEETLFQLIKHDWNWWEITVFVGIIVTFTYTSISHIKNIIKPDLEDEDTE